jgi:U3 small nucleolar RNA-associated protein 22
MILVIPTKLLQEKDYLDLRYFYKRAYFLAKIAASVKREYKDELQASFENLNGNMLLPVLSLRPKRTEHKTKTAIEAGKSSRIHWRIRLIPCVPDNFFAKDKMSSAASLVRKGGKDAQTASRIPTPFYNSTLKAEGTFIAYLKVLRQAEKSCAAFQDACILGRIWLQQRGFGGSISRGGFGHFEWAALMAILLKTGGRKEQALLSPSLNSTQLFKAMIQYLAGTNFSKTACVLGTAVEKLEDIRESGPVIYDSARRLNLAFKMSPWSSLLLRQHAKWTHELLSDNQADHFNPTFITRADDAVQLFDMVLRVPLLGPGAGCDEDPRGHVWVTSTKLYNTIKKALGNRARMINVTGEAPSTWHLNEQRSSSGTSSLLVGVLLDSTHMTRQVDHGPPAEDKKEAQKFRQFWGEKSELRRFKDGSILETLIWTSTMATDTCEEIIRYILRLHLKLEIDVEKLMFYGKDVTTLVPIKATDVSAFGIARQALETFERDIRNLEGLPLQIRQVGPACEELRLTSVKAPSFSFKTGSQPMDVIISFEASGKWPDNLEAIQRTKVAFLLKIGSLLEAAKREITSHIGLEESPRDIENLAYLDIVYASGVGFRLRIHSDLEESLLDRRAKDKTLEQHIRTESATILSNFRRQHSMLPLHTQNMRTYATRFPALSPTVRLLKHWFDEHKFSIHFHADLIELIALHVFLTPYPWDQPSSATTGFLRCLFFLSRWDWRSEPLVIDTGSADTDEAGEAKLSAQNVSTSASLTRLQAWRTLDPGMHRAVLFAVTPYSVSGLLHSTDVSGAAHPCKVVAARMTTLARSACRMVRDGGVDALTGVSARSLFAPALSDFDVVIRLDRKALRRCGRNYKFEDAEADLNDTGSSRFKNLDARTAEMPLPVARYPAREFVELLSRTYGAGAAGPGLLVFFHGAEDDCIVSAVWNPMMTQKPFSVRLAGSYQPLSTRCNDEESDDVGGDDDDVKEKIVVEVNREGILAEIARIGGDLIEKIDVKAT